MIPEYMQPSIDLWVQHGLPHPNAMGSFLRAVLVHDLIGAVRHGDDTNRASLVNWATYLYSDVPSLAHGSMDRLLAWHERGGLTGRKPDGLDAYRIAAGLPTSGEAA